MPLSEIHQRGLKLRRSLQGAGFPQYATKLLEWSPSLNDVPNVRMRIQQIANGRGHRYDEVLLVELEKVAARGLSKHSNAA